jgi:hypothetical protein
VIIEARRLILPIAPLTGRDQPVLGVEHFVQRHDFPTAALRTLPMRDDHYAHWYSPFLRGRDEPILRTEFAMDLDLSRQELLLIAHLTFSCDFIVWKGIARKNSPRSGFPVSPHARNSLSM